MATSNSLSYSHEKKEMGDSGPVYLREDEVDSNEDSKEVHRTITRITALGSRAGTVQNYNAQGDTILLPTPSDDP